MATRIYHGHLELPSFAERAVATPEIQSLCQRVFITEDPDYTRAYPHRQQCDVTVVRRDGTRIAGHSERMKGEPENPYSPRELEDKYFGLTRELWGDAMARRVLADCLRLETIPDFRACSSAYSL
jgi:2-methylcitrate dehydratase PrpD